MNTRQKHLEELLKQIHELADHPVLIENEMFNLELLNDSRETFYLYLSGEKSYEYASGYLQRRIDTLNAHISIWS